MRALHLVALTCLSVALSSSPAAAQNCVGTGSFRTCYDAQSGNSYTIQKFGNTTITSGSNAQTGSTWSQTDQKLGNSTITTGRAANGNSWSKTQQSTGSTTFGSGIDSKGNPFSYTCTAYGCN